MGSEICIVDRVKVLFVGKEFYGLIDQIRAELQDLEHIIAIDGDREDWKAYSAWRDSQLTDPPGLTTLDDDYVIQLYTSVTTGMPKCVHMTNGHLCAILEQAGILSLAI